MQMMVMIMMTVSELKPADCTEMEEGAGVAHRESGNMHRRRRHMPFAVSIILAAPAEARQAVPNHEHTTP